jgi:hypothetical protein
MNPFEFVKSINETKEDIMTDDLAEKSYNAFVVNRSLSYFLDTIFQANEMNRLFHIPKNMQYRFLINTIRPKKRYSGKWHKQEKNAEVELIMEVYNYSQEKAQQVLPLFSVADIKELVKMVDPGGISTKK